MGQSNKQQATLMRCHLSQCDKYYPCECKCDLCEGGTYYLREWKCYLRDYDALTHSAPSDVSTSYLYMYIHHQRMTLPPYVSLAAGHYCYSSGDTSSFISHIDGWRFFIHLSFTAIPDLVTTVFVTFPGLLETLPTQRVTVDDCFLQCYSILR